MIHGCLSRNLAVDLKRVPNLCNASLLSLHAALTHIALHTPNQDLSVFISFRAPEYLFIPGHIFSSVKYNQMTIRGSASVHVFCGLGKPFFYSCFKALVQYLKFNNHFLRLPNPWSLLLAPWSLNSLYHQKISPHPPQSILPLNPNVIQNNITYRLSYIK